MRTLSLLALLCALVACGNKGPLYLPDAPSDESSERTV